MNQSQEISLLKAKVAQLEADNKVLSEKLFLEVCFHETTRKENKLLKLLVRQSSTTSSSQMSKRC